MPRWPLVLLRRPRPLVVPLPLRPSVEFPLRRALLVLLLRLGSVVLLVSVASVALPVCLVSAVPPVPLVSLAVLVSKAVGAVCRAVCVVSRAARQAMAAPAARQDIAPAALQAIATAIAGRDTATPDVTVRMVSMFPAVAAIPMPMTAALIATSTGEAPTDAFWSAPEAE
jgi:hypothetical protein